MAQITLKGNRVHTIGDLPENGLTVKDFALVNDKLEEKVLSDYDGKKKIFNIFPSIDTGICAASARIRCRRHRRHRRDRHRPARLRLPAADADRPAAGAGAGVARAAQDDGMPACQRRGQGTLMAALCNGVCPCTEH